MLKKGRLEVILLFVLGLVTLSSVAIFAGKQEEKRQATEVACRLNPQKPGCPTPTPRAISTPLPSPSLPPLPAR